MLSAADIGTLSGLLALARKEPTPENHASLLTCLVESLLEAAEEEAAEDEEEGGYWEPEYEYGPEPDWDEMVPDSEDGPIEAVPIIDHLCLNSIQADDGPLT